MENNKMENLLNKEIQEYLVHNYQSPQNELGIGKVMHIEHSNESIVTDGISLISLTDTQLQDENSVTVEEKCRIKSLANTLIHNNQGEKVVAEITLTKSDVKDLLVHLSTPANNTHTHVQYNRTFKSVGVFNTPDSVWIKYMGNDIATGEDVSESVYTAQLVKVLEVVDLVIDDSDVVTILIQSNMRPILINNDKVKACISCYKNV